MTRMSAPNRCDPMGKRTGIQPVAQLCADRPTRAVAHQRIMFAGFSRNDKKHARILRQRLLDGAHQPRMGRGQGMAMQVDGGIGNERAGGNTSIPPAIKPVTVCVRSGRHGRGLKASSG